ncbi:MAG TPA: DNA mismatch repair protein MutL, partial [Planctomycetaceae bacterium]|nr:DNA mismatch repair protein MutL [Planctomycetaceae bacterium]
AAPPAGAGAADRPRAMQVLDRYIIFEGDEGVVVIDQHALHERVLYEQLRKRILAGQVESQRLLVPRPVELSAREAATLLDHQDLLSQLGFGIEPFGTNTVLLTRYPALLARADLDRLLRDLAEQIGCGGPAPTRRDLLDELLHMMACKAAVKAGQRLTSEEIASLLEQRHLIDDAHHCPHGRPTALVLSQAELDRQFGRMG